MKLTDFHYELPEHLIANYPATERTASRLLTLDGNTGALEDGTFADIVSLLEPGDLLVFNDTRVIPARLFAEKATGGKVEVLIERVLDEQHTLAQVKASKSPKPGSRLRIAGQLDVEVLGRKDHFFRLALTGEASWLSVLEQYGHMPLPPYIERADQDMDKERYQTVYNKHPGAVAAPTAGLHFDQPLLDKLAQRGIHQAFVTLHVGAGTFQPVRVDDIREHQMHSEVAKMGAEVAAKIIATKAAGKRVIAVGTTSVRTLESAAKHFGSLDRISEYEQDTNIFIYPGYQFELVDAMITNFHLPESTLIMLVSAFAGRDHVLNAYRHAVQKEYRFFSYGDAMFITANRSR